MRYFLNQYFSATTGALIGRGPVFLLPFVLVGTGLSGALADQILLLLALAWFFPLVVSNVFVDLFVNGMESKTALVGKKAWGGFSFLSAFFPAVASIFVHNSEILMHLVLGAVFVFLSSFFGLLCSRLVALCIVEDKQFWAGLSNITRLLILFAIGLSSAHPVIGVLAAAATAEFLRWLMLIARLKENASQWVDEFPSGLLQLVGGALLVAVAQYYQRWLIAQCAEGHVLWYEIADKIYSLVALGLTLGLSGVLQRHVTKHILGGVTPSIRPLMLVGVSVGLSGAFLCWVAVLALFALNESMDMLHGINVKLVYPLVIIMSIGFIPAAMTMVLSRIFVARNFSQAVLSLSFLSAMVTTLGSYLASQLWGTFGVAAVSAFTNFLIFFMYLWLWFVAQRSFHTRAV